MTHFTGHCRIAAIEATECQHTESRLRRRANRDLDESLRCVTEPLGGTWSSSDTPQHTRRATDPADKGRERESPSTTAHLLDLRAVYLTTTVHKCLISPGRSPLPLLRRSNLAGMLRFLTAMAVSAAVSWVPRAFVQASSTSLSRLALP